MMKKTIYGVPIINSKNWNPHAVLWCLNVINYIMPVLISTIIRALRHIRPILDANTARLVGHALVKLPTWLRQLLSCMACLSPWPLSSSANKTCWARVDSANESIEQCRTTAQSTSLASSGIEDPVQNSWPSHTKFSAHAHHLICPTHAWATYKPTRQLRSIQLKSPGTTTLQN